MALLTEPDIPNGNLTRPGRECTCSGGKGQVRKEIIEVDNLTAAGARKLKKWFSAEGLRYTHKMGNVPP
jgi:hypothetical protein